MSKASSVSVDGRVLAAAAAGGLLAAAAFGWLAGRFFGAGDRNNELNKDDGSGKKGAAISQAVPVPAAAAAEPPLVDSFPPGRIALVTGASGAIGRAIALRFARSGVSLALHYFSDAAGAAETARLALAAGAPAARTYQADLSGGSSSGESSLVDAVVRDFGAIHVAVINHGVFNVCDPLTASFAAFQAHFATSIGTNLTSAAHLSFLVAEAMRRQRPQPPPVGAPSAVAAAAPPAAAGAIVYVGSRGAYRGEPQAWGYAASKAGLHALAQSQAITLGQHGIVVNAVAPGFVHTKMAEAALQGPGGDGIRGQSSWGRVATADEVANCVAFLAAYHSNAWVTGAILDCNGASFLR